MKQVGFRQGEEQGHEGCTTALVDPWERLTARHSRRQEQPEQVAPLQVDARQELQPG